MADLTDGLRRAVKLFNRWQFQEATDAFAALANQYDGREKAFLEGISLVSSGFYRIWHKGGEANAMVSHLQKGLELLAEFPKGALGVETDGFDERVRHCLDEAMKWRRGDEEIFNRDMIPRLEFRPEGAEGKG